MKMNTMIIDGKEIDISKITPPEFKKGDAVKFMEEGSIVLVYGKIVRVCKDSCLVDGGDYGLCRVNKRNLNWV